MTSPQHQEPQQGLRSLTADEFNMLDSVGGVRGLIEATAPGLIYLVVYVTTGELAPALIGSLGVAALLVIVRLIQRTPVTMAFSGVFGVAIGLFIAWKSGDATDFYVWGLLVNAAYMLVLGISLVVRWPAVGVMVEMLKSGLGSTSSDAAKVRTSPEEPVTQSVEPATQSLAPAAQGIEPAPGLRSDPDRDQPDASAPAFAWPTRWRKDPLALKKYTIATWIWVAMFALRLGVQGPLYLAGSDYIAALGTARLVMGVPLFALVLWFTWRLVRQPESVATQTD